MSQYLITFYDCQVFIEGQKRTFFRHYQMTYYLMSCSAVKFQPQSLQLLVKLLSIGRKLQAHDKMKSKYNGK